MIKRLPQEIADMLMAYVAQDQAGGWYAYNSAPRRDSRTWYDGADASIGLNVSHMIETPAAHDWTKLYEPQGKEGKTEEDFPYFTETADSDNKQDAYSGKQADSDNKHQSDNTWETHEKTHGSTHEASHQSQVHVHQEYDVIYAEYPEQLSIKVTQLIHEGWKPVGGIVCLPPAHREDSETFYQAMVRGLE